MKVTGIGAAVPAGRVDKALNVIEGNNYLYELMGVYVHFSLYKMVREEDMAKLEKAVKKCSKTAEHFVDELIHIQKEEGEYEEYIISIRKCPDMDCFYIELFNMSEDRKRIEETSRKMTLARDYLTLNGDILSEYHPADDFFRVFWLNHEQTVEMYQMSLSEWKKCMLQKGWIKEEDKIIFTSFCEAMKKTEDIQDYTFSSSMLSNGEHLETYRIKLLKRNYDGADVVLGVWSVINETTAKEYDSYVEDAYVDALTRLLNKKTITEYAQRAVEGREKQLAIVVMDVDNFKNVNDTYGHLFGDQVIKAVADVIKKVIGNKGMAGRIGGDEFMLVLEDYEDEVNLRNYLRSIRVNVEALFQDKMGNNGLSCSVGVSRSDVDGGEFKDLFKTADKALYIAKQKGKNRYIIYKKELHGHLAVGDTNYDMLDIRKSYYSDADIREVNRLLGEVAAYGSSVIPALLEQAAHTLLVDRITVFYKKEEIKPIAVFRTGQEEAVVDAKIVMDKKYLENFKENLYIISNVNNLEYRIPTLYECLKEANVCSSMQYLLRDSKGNIKGAIMADECKKICIFPKVAVQIFENMCEILKGVLEREENQ